MKKYFIFGITGLIGKCLAKTIGVKDVIGFGSEVDVCNRELVAAKLSADRPEVIFFCANNQGGVTAAENNPEYAIQFHYIAVKNIVDFCKKNNTSFVFLSTTYTYGDTPESPPLSVYGKAKLLAENYIKENLKSFLIIRTVNVFGPDTTSKTPNFYQQVLNQIEKNEVFIAAENVMCNPTSVTDLVKSILYLLENKSWGQHLIVGPETISRYEWASRISNNNLLVRPFNDHCTYRPKNQRFTNVKWPYMI
jgi:dTDP-4-dehydrorhamnose reductase